MCASIFPMDNLHPSFDRTRAQTIALIWSHEELLARSTESCSQGRRMTRETYSRSALYVRVKLRVLNDGCDRLLHLRNLGQCYLPTARPAGLSHRTVFCDATLMTLASASLKKRECHSVTCYMEVGFTKESHEESGTTRTYHGTGTAALVTNAIEE